jgi:serine/threonine-protein kinase
MPNLVGLTLGRYQLVDRLGHGGMADVYKAYQPGLDRFVAIKVLHPHLAEQPDFVTRFKREAQSVSSLYHPNIIQVFDFDIQGDNYYMAMAFIEGGRTLKEVLFELAQAGDLLPIEQVLDITAQIADALSYAHQRGMIHRDIKPANILVPAMNHPILSDFGIAHIVDMTTLTRSGAMVGTPAYMSPEQGSGAKVTERTDIYALGVTLYEMLTGKPPYDADTPYAVIIKHISDPLVPPHLLAPVPISVEPIVLKALAKNPEDRFSSADEMANVLRMVLRTIQTKSDIAYPQPEPALAGNGQDGSSLNSSRLPTEQSNSTPPFPVPAPASRATKREWAQWLNGRVLALGGMIILAAALTWYLAASNSQLALPPLYPAAPTTAPALPHATATPGNSTAIDESNAAGPTSTLPGASATLPAAATAAAGATTQGGSTEIPDTPVITLLPELPTEILPPVETTLPVAPPLPPVLP